jgi:hypothetical protein
MAEKRTKSDGFMLRFPDGMRDRLKKEADGNNRSMNAEIIERLEESLTRWPVVQLPDEVRAAAWELPVDEMLSAERDIDEYATKRVTSALREQEVMRENFLYQVEEIIGYAPAEDQPRLREEMRRLMQRAGLVGGPKIDEWPYK